MQLSVRCHISVLTASYDFLKVARATRSIFSIKECDKAAVMSVVEVSSRLSLTDNKEDVAGWLAAG